MTIKEEVRRGTDTSVRTPPPPRTCRRCNGSGRNRQQPECTHDEPCPDWACETCRGTGKQPPRGHALDDGCNATHAFVLDPCAFCGKSETDWRRHMCAELRAEKPKPCKGSPLGFHHLFEPGERDMTSTREGCRTHGVSFDDVQRWWGIVSERELNVSCCACCLGPCRITEMTPFGNLNVFCDRCIDAAGEAA